MLIRLSANLFMANDIKAHLSIEPADNGVSRYLTFLKDHKIPRNEIFTNTTLLRNFLDEDFSRDILPVPCHSHNDYLRDVPLFDALSAGCSGVEADIWVDPDDSNNLLVGHERNALHPARTLKSMYIDPIVSVLETMNHGNTGILSGPFEVSPNTTLVLLIDFKMSPDLLWPLLQSHLTTLRERGYLQYWNETSQTLVPGPVTIVASGSIDQKPSLVRSSSTNPQHDIFLDAPLLSLSSTATSSASYNISNSYYASSALNPALGTIHFTPSLLALPDDYDVFTASQFKKLREQTNAAQALGLKARYWGTPNWPVGVRNSVWSALVEQVGVDVLNVDDLEGAARWDWAECMIGWIGIC